MRHVIMTCKHHPNLRWNCKDIAFTDAGGYNGQRNIRFTGQLPGVRHSDGSGFCYQPADECSCPPSELIRAPEDILVKREDGTDLLASGQRVTGVEIYADGVINLDVETPRTIKDVVAALPETD